jgi:hypothetical protein
VRIENELITSKFFKLMKRIFSIVFLIGLIASVAFGSLEAGAVSLAGLAFTAESWFTEYSFITIVPGVMYAPSRETAMAQGLQEVPPMTRAEKALYDQLVVLGRANAVTQQAIEQGAISFDPVSYYIRYDITGLSGNQKFISAATLKVLGTTNLPNGASLQQYYNFCFDRIFVRTATTNTANTAINTVGGYTSVSASMDPAVRNGELIIRSNRNIIVETPVVDFVTEAAVTGGGAREYAGGILEKPRFFLELLSIEAEIALAGTATATANTTTYLEVIFSGVQARLKS